VTTSPEKEVNGPHLADHHVPGGERHFRAAPGRCPSPAAHIQVRWYSFRHLLRLLLSRCGGSLSDTDTAPNTLKVTIRSDVASHDGALDDDEQRTWRCVPGREQTPDGHPGPPAPAEAGIPHTYYEILVRLSEVPDRHCGCRSWRCPRCLAQPGSPRGWLGWRRPDGYSGENARPPRGAVLRAHLRRIRRVASRPRRVM